MSLFKVFDISTSAMTAESVRLNTTASNLANAESASSSVETTYRARHPVFQAVFEQSQGALGRPDAAAGAGVRVAGVVEDASPLRQEYQPGHPLANEEGYVFLPNVNAVDEMVNMISASRSYQMNTETFNTAKQLLLATLRLGQG